MFGAGAGAGAGMAKARFSCKRRGKNIEGGFIFGRSGVHLTVRLFDCD